jgi:hypothetical protein
MSFLERPVTRTYIAGADLSAKQFHFVSLGTTTVDVTGAGLAAEGVLINTPTSGQAATVVYDGRVTVLAAGTISAGADVASDASGQAVAATTGDIILGRAYEAAVTGQYITVELVRAGNTA